MMRALFRLLLLPGACLLSSAAAASCNLPGHGADAERQYRDIANRGHSGLLQPGIATGCDNLAGHAVAGQELPR